MSRNKSYLFFSLDNDDYEVSWVEFKTEQLENFNWNRMDFYVCTRGDKVWRNLYLLTPDQ